MSKSLHERILDLKNLSIERSKLVSPKQKKQPLSDSNKVIVPHILPSCSNDIRTIPNAVLRGALFGVVGKGKRKYEKNILKSTINGITVRFTGEQLDQADLDVWMECIHLSKKCNFGEKIYFSSHYFLKCIKRSIGKSQHEWLKLSLLRLSSCVLEVGDGRFFYVGHLLHEWYRDEDTGDNVIVLNPKIATLFSADLWTGLSAVQRAALKGKSLAQWLHGFYSTHDRPLGYKVETLMRLCGSEISILKKFRQLIKKSLIDLTSATGWKCWIDENDLVQVKKK